MKALNIQKKDAEVRLTAIQEEKDGLLEVRIRLEGEV